MTKFKSDTQWLEEKMGGRGLTPTAFEIDFFVEKVSILTCDGFLNEENARLTAYHMIRR